MIDREHALPLTRQAAVLRLSRSGLYYRPRPVAPADLAVMRRIDELRLDYPFAGSRMLRDLPRGEGVSIGRQRVATMMRRMGIEAIYRRHRCLADILTRVADLPISRIGELLPRPCAHHALDGGGGRPRREAPRTGEVGSARF